MLVQTKSIHQKLQLELIHQVAIKLSSLSIFGATVLLVSHGTKCMLCRLDQVCAPATFNTDFSSKYLPAIACFHPTDTKSKHKWDPLGVRTETKTVCAL